MKALLLLALLIPTGGPYHRDVKSQCKKSYDSMGCCNGTKKKFICIGGNDLLSCTPTTGSSCSTGGNCGTVQTTGCPH